MNVWKSGWLGWVLWATTGLSAHALEPPSLAQLTQQSGLDEAVVRLVAQAGSNPQPLQVVSKGRSTPGLTVQVAGGRAAAQAEWLRQQLDPEHVVFVSQRRHGMGRAPDDVSVIRSKDRFAPLRLMGTAGPAIDLKHQRIVAKLRDWDRRYGVQLIGVGRDWVDVRLQRLPDPLRRFAIEVYEFCPDVVSEVEAVDRLGDELQLTRTLHLAWGRATWDRPRPPLPEGITPVHQRTPTSTHPSS